MVFWFWVAIMLLMVPPIAYGLVMAALYLCARRRLFEARAKPEPRRRSMWGWGGPW